MKSIKKQLTDKSLLPVTAYVVGMLLISLCGLAVQAQIATLQGKSEPGTRPKNYPPGNPKLDPPLIGITPVITQTGNITLSIDGLGTLNSIGIIDVEKPAGATVRAAYLAAASTGFTGRTLVNGDVKINGSNVNFTTTVPSTIGSSNSFGDVTAIVKPIVDAAPEGVVSLTITEVNSAGIDGEILAVIFDDPAQTTTNTVFILFGAQNIAGDTFNITTSAPIDPLKPIDLSLGISFGSQTPATANQESFIEVNGIRLSSSAGGQDDSDGQVVDNGLLLTVGGLGDSNANPPPFATNGGNPRTDDELYDLRPFVTAGSTNISVFTQNPSNDDNIFFAGFFFKDATGTIGGDCILTCPANLVTSNTADQCSAVVMYPAPTTAGTCGTVSCSPASGSTFPKGTTTITCTAVGPPPQTCTFTVTVNDTQAPTLTCPPNQSATSSGGNVTVTYPPPTVSDNCSDVGTPSCTPASGSSFPAGLTTVNCSVTDASGNLTTCTFTVSVSACAIACPANITKSNDQNQCGAVTTYSAPTGTKDCGTITCAPASGSFFPVGTTTVTCTASAGAICAFTVTVNDTQAPTLTCPANIIRIAAPACAGAAGTVTYPPPTASDNCPGVTTVCSPASGSIFPLGTTTVTCTATDASGNTASCSFAVKVFNACIQDRSNPNAVLAWNFTTGEYIFCCNGSSFTGIGKVSVIGCIYTLDHTPIDRRVHGQVDFTTFRGEGFLQVPSGTARCSISDDDVRDNDCSCTGAPPSAGPGSK